MKKFFAIALGIFLILATNDSYAARRGNQGCCSYHRGVSHCDTSKSRLVCRDGTYSASCRCNGR